MKRRSFLGLLAFMLPSAKAVATQQPDRSTPSRKHYEHLASFPAECVADEVEVFGAMSNAIYKLPKLPEPPSPGAAHLDAIWRADADAFGMMKRQAGEQNNILIPVIEAAPASRRAFRGIPIEMVDG